MKHHHSPRFSFARWCTQSLGLVLLLGTADPAFAQEEEGADDQAEKSPAEAEKPPADDDPDADRQDDEPESTAEDAAEEADSGGPAEEADASERAPSDRDQKRTQGGKTAKQATTAVRTDTTEAPPSSPAGTEPRDPGSGQALVTRLPPSPERRVRGIKGGSLSKTWHGLQWPHYARTGIPLSGNVWVDNGYETLDRSLENEENRQYWIQAGYFKLRATPTCTKGRMFVQGQGELLAWTNPILGNVPIDVDDAWVKFGAWDAWDIQVGRFETWEVYHKGMGLDLYTLEYIGAFTEDDPGAVRLYELSHIFYREELAYGRFAAHFYPTDFLRFELGGVLGNNGSALNAWGVRPVAVLDLGWLKFKAGAEYRQDMRWDDNPWEIKRRGFGGALQFVIDPPLEFGVNAAYAVVDAIRDDGLVNETASITPLSIGGFVNVAPFGDLVLGAGVHHTTQEDRQFNGPTPGKFEHLQAFGAIQHPIITDAFTAKLVLAHAKADMYPGFDAEKHNQMYSARLRLLYEF